MPEKALNINKEAPNEGQRQDIRIDLGKSVNAIAICAAFCGLCFAFCLFTAIVAWDAKTEARMVEYYLMDPHYRTPEELQAWAKFKQENQ